MRISDWSSDVCSSDLWWDEAQARWQSYDSVDFEPDKRPDYRPDWRKKPVGMAALRGDEPFIMMTDGRGAIFSPSGLKDGPLPTHYEPVESAVHNPLHRQQSTPVAKKWRRPGQPLPIGSASCRERVWPYV